MGEPKNMMKATFRKDAEVIYTDKKKNVYKAKVVGSKRVGDMDFFEYTVKMTEKKVDTGDGPTWEEYDGVDSGVSDYQLELP